MPTDTPSPLAAAVEALLEQQDECAFIDGPSVGAHHIKALRAALASDAAWQPAEVAPNPHEALGRALCKAAGIDPDAAISDAGHSAWELVAHDALRGVLPTELRDAAWRARAEAAVEHSDAALAAKAIWEKWRHRKTKDLQDAEDTAARRLVDYDAARRRYEEAARG